MAIMAARASQGQIAGLGRFLSVVFHPCAPDQQPMGVDAHGGAGDQGAEVLPLHHIQRLHLVRLHRQNLVHLIGQGFIQNVQIEPVPQRQLVQIGKELRLCQPSVAGQGAVGALSTQRIAGFRQVADSVGEHIRPGALVDGQVQVDFGDGDIPQGVAQLDQIDVAVPGDALSLGVFAEHRFQLLIVGLRRLLDGVDFHPFQGIDGFIVFLHRHGGIPVRQGIADERIGEHSGAGENHQNREADYDLSGFFHRKLL